MITTDKADATEADVEGWAAEHGYIVANPAPIPAHVIVESDGRTWSPGPDRFVWRAEIVAEERIA